MMNEHAYFHWDLLRQPLQSSQFGMGAPFFDVNSILELRKEKSRDAARSRRGKENYEFYELAKLLPLPAAITSQLDKASIIRLTISYLKLRDFSSHGEPQWTPEGGMGVNKLSKTHHQSRLDIMDPFESRQGTHILQSLDGFAFILASDGRFLYISETVSIYLGLSQVEMAGSSIFEYVHPQDHTELAEQLGMCMVPIGPSRSPHGSGSEDGSSPATPRPGSPSEKGYMMVQSPEKGDHKSFSLRMKSTLTKRGVHVKTSGYRVVHVLGTLRQQSAFGLRPGGQGNTNCNIPSNNNNSNTSDAPPLLGLVGMAIALPPPTITELRLELDTFITKMSPDFKVIYCEPIINDLMDLTVDDVTDRLLYDLCHAADLKSLRRSHLDILNKGQALTDYYRLMNRHGGYIWIQTCATTLLNNKNADDQSILAINFVVSGIEGSNCAMDLWQLTGDVTSSMSSASNSQSREEKLKELRTKKAPCTLSVKTLPDSPRVKSASSNSNISREESSKSDSKTPENTSPKIPPDNSAEDTEAASPDKNAGSLDNKNKRRKMENPRKRKRSNSEHQVMEDGDKALNLTQNDAKTSVIARTPKNSVTDGQNEKCVNKRRADSAVTCLPNDNVTSSSPEDLSIKRSTRRSADRSIIQHSSTVFRNTLSPNADKHKSTSFLNIQDSTSSSQLTITGSSVKELEAAMNRHLPTSSSSTAFHSQHDKNSFENVIADSTGTAKTYSGITSSQSPSTSWLPTSSRHGTEMLTASNFLRSLYANRESVIKTNSRSQTSFLNNDPPTSLLLTPPEPDPSTYRDPNNPYSYGKSDFSNHSYIYDKETGLETRDIYKDQTNRDQFSFIPYKDHISTAYIDHISSAVYKDHLTSTYKELSPYKDIIPAFTIPSLMSPTGRMHQAYSSFHHHFTVPIPATNMDTCSSITPPSSNSPDSNKHASNSQQVEPTTYFTDVNNACNLAQKQTMNNSLSPPSLSPATPGHHYHHPRHYIDHFYQGVNGVDAGKSGYYSIPSTTAGSIYADLNQNVSTPVQYDACTRPVIPWY